VARAQVLSSIRCGLPLCSQNALARYDGCSCAASMVDEGLVCIGSLLTSVPIIAPALFINRGSERRSLTMSSTRRVTAARGGA
jgi:hypothetical protein